ncbi:MAG: DAK2 domain-containing protein [Dehalococcoidales bacterium]
MTQKNTIGGPDLKEMFAAATDWLEKSASDIDALNVFPVPDGDCGTNMLLTMRSAIEEAGRETAGGISPVAQAMAKGALMGARGNSGVILSQIWRGFAESLDDEETIDGSGLAEALLQASQTAYQGVSDPVEGTILTVIKDAARAAETQASGDNGNVISVLEASVDAAKESVANTPNLLAVLREAGVVDAGGQGLYTLLEGALLYLRGEVESMQFRKSRVIASSTPLSARPLQVSAADEVAFGYCTEFLLKGEGLDPEKLKKKLKSKGESLIVVGDEATARVHIHTLDPGNVIHYVTSLGTVHKVSIRNMDEQHEDFLAMQKTKIPTADMGIVAIVAGDGLADVFSSLGASAIVSGGQTMNPSTKEILQAVEAVPSDKIIILPNNKNIVPAAEQVKSLTDKSVMVIPTETIPQGVVALLAFDYEADFDTNSRFMTEAKSTVKTIEITRATRSTSLNGLDIKKKQAIGLLNGKLLAASNEPSDVLGNLLTRIELAKAEVITIYYGADTKEAEAEQVIAAIREQYPHLQVEIVSGGQPYYNYIVSIE